jgi:hypothetical protein
MVNFYAQHRRRAFRGSGGPAGVEPETDTLLAALTGTYNSAQQTAIDTLIKDLKSAGAWGLLDVLCIAGLNSADSLINWKSPGTFNSTAISSPTFTADRGFTGTTFGYIDTNFNPSTAGGNFSQNANMFGVYSRTESNPAFPPNFPVDIGIISSSNQIVLHSRLGGQIFGRANEVAVADGATNASSLGKFLVTRQSSSSVITYRNGTSVQSKSTTSLALSNFNANIFVCAANNGSGTPVPESRSTRQYAAWYIGGWGSGLSPSAFNTAMQTYLTSIGANV